MSERKRCPRCGTSKPLAEFPRDSYTGKHRASCKTCYASRTWTPVSKRGEFDMRPLLAVWPLGTPIEKPGRVVEFGWKAPV
jgi:hypothetical protein